MLHDLISVKKTEFDSFVTDIASATINEGAHWRHSYKSPHHSVSIKFDKYVAEKIKDMVLALNPKQGAFAGKSIFALIERHKNNKFVLVADIKGYFETIQFSEVQNSLSKSQELAPHTELIRRFYFNEHGTLKRGLRASSVLSEFIGLKIDSIVRSLIHSHELEYSRYYDDLIISGMDRSELEILKSTLETKILSDLNLMFNQRKTKIRKLHGMKILGLRFHAGEIKVPQSFKDKIRAAEHSYVIAEYDEEDYDSIRDAKRHVGMIIGSIRYLLDYSPNLAKGTYEAKLSEYYDELNRLEEIRQELVEVVDEDAHW